MQPSKRRLRALALLLLPLTVACREMPKEQYVALLTEAHDSMTARNQRLETAFHLGSYPRWDWSQDKGLLVFSDSGVAKVIADIQFVGNVSTRDSTFLWAWANTTLDPRLSRASRAARRYGILHGISRLKNEHWAADQVDGWEMTTLAGYIDHSQGVYRAPDPESGAYDFLLLDHVRWAPPNTRVSDILGND